LKIAIEVIGQRLAGKVHIFLFGDLVTFIEAMDGHVLGNITQQYMGLGQGPSLLSIHLVLGHAGEYSRIRGQEGHLVYAFHTQFTGSRLRQELWVVAKIDCKFGSKGLGCGL